MNDDGAFDYDKYMGKKAGEADVKKEGQKDAVQKYIDEIPKRKAEAEQRMKDYKEGNAKSMGQFNANMQKIGEAHDAKMKELRDTTKSGGGGGGGSGSMTDPMDRKTKPYNKAKGGVIKSASKRADGIAIRGRTRA
jgi:hypothetical protein